MPHLHPVYDTDQYFSIDENNRTITFMGDGLPVLTQGDHNSERFTFELPRYIDGHDMTKCNKVEVHFINANAADPANRSCDIYKVTDLQVDEDDSSLALCSWLISGNATRYVGPLSFALHFECITNSVTDYSWHTNPYTKTLVTSTIDNTDNSMSEFNVILDPDNPQIDLNGFYTGSVAIVPQAKRVTPTDSTQVVEPDEGMVLSKVMVEPVSSDHIKPTGTIDITENGTYNVSSYETAAVYVSSATGGRLSGTWAFDTSKLLDNIPYIPGKTISATVAYSNGVPGSDEGLKYYTSMTFDLTARTLKFDDMTAFYVELGVWSNGEYGTRINFTGVQKVSLDFYDMFTQVATYVSGAVSSGAIQDSKIVYIDKVGIEYVNPDEGYDGIRQVTVISNLPTGGGGNGSGGGPISFADDGNGNVTLSSGGVITAMVDDGNGNIMIGE
jgi:hypothetical protein